MINARIEFRIPMQNLDFSATHDVEASEQRIRINADSTTQRIIE